MTTPRYVDRVPWVPNALVCPYTDKTVTEFDPVFLFGVMYARELIIRAMIRADVTRGRPFTDRG